MTAPIHTEARFEDEICAHLAQHGWLYNSLKPYDAGYDKRLALFPEDAIAWVKETQPETWEKFAKNHAKNPEAVFLQWLAEELDSERPTIKLDTPQLWGTLYILRKGFKDINATFRMAQFAPSNQQNPTTWTHFGKNRLRVVRQVRYSLHNEKCIDLVLFLNGLPIATIELKTDTTQNIEDAVKQYKYDRPPIDTTSKQAEPLLSFGKRALVHFAVSTDEVRMATFKGYATTLIGKMVADATLQEQAKANDTAESFSNGAYEQKLTGAVVDALEGHSAMADQALKHPTVFKGLASLLLDEVYRQLRKH